MMSLTLCMLIIILKQASTDPHIAIVIEDRYDHIRGSLRTAATNLITAYERESFFAVLFCETSIKKNCSRRVCKSFIASSKGHSSCNVMAACDKAKDILQQGGGSFKRIYIVRFGNLSIGNKDLFFRYQHEQIEVTELCLVNNKLCFLYFYEFDQRQYLFELPQLKIHPNSFPSSLPPTLSHLEVQVPQLLDLSPSFHLRFELKAILIYRSDLSGNFFKFKNIEYTKEWIERNKDLERVFPVRNHEFANIRVFFRKDCQGCNRPSQSIMMNDYGLEPDAEANDRQYTEKLYCDDIEVVSHYDSWIVLMDLDHSMVRYYQTWPITVQKVIGNWECHTNIVKPARMTKLKFIKENGVLSIIFIAVGGDGMRNRLFRYETKIKVEETSELFEATYEANYYPFSVVCFQIEIHNFDLRNQIYLQMRALDTFQITNDWSPWILAQDDSVPTNICDPDRRSNIIVETTTKRGYAFSVEHLLLFFVLIYCIVFLVFRNQSH